jgi:hypothetical protein
VLSRNAKNETHDWRDQFLSPRSQHKRSQSLTFEPRGVKTMPINMLVKDKDNDNWHDSKPRIPLAELEEQLRHMEELIERKFAKQEPAMEAQSAAELKKSRRRSLNQLLRRSTNKITGHKHRKDTIDKAKKADDDNNDDDGGEDDEATELSDEGSGIYAIPTSIYTKVTNRRRSVYHYNLDSIREMIHQHHQHQHQHATAKTDGDHDQPQPALLEENEARDGGKNEDGKGEGEGDDVMLGIEPPIKIVLTAPSSPPVPTLNLNELPQDEGFLSPDAPKATSLLPPPCHVSVSSTATSAFVSSSPSTSTKTATSTSTESEAAAARNWRRTVHDKRDKMLRMRVMDSKFAGQAKNVKWAFLWCEENVAPVTLVKVVKAQAFAKRFLARRRTLRVRMCVPYFVFTF